MVVEPSLYLHLVLVTAKRCGCCLMLRWRTAQAEREPLDQVGLDGLGHPLPIVRRVDHTFAIRVMATKGA